MTDAAAVSSLLPALVVPVATPLGPAAAAALRAAPGQWFDVLHEEWQSARSSRNRHHALHLHDEPKPFPADHGDRLIVQFGPAGTLDGLREFGLAYGAHWLGSGPGALTEHTHSRAFAALVTAFVADPTVNPAHLARLAVLLTGRQLPLENSYELTEAMGEVLTAWRQAHGATNGSRAFLAAAAALGVPPVADQLLGQRPGSWPLDDLHEYFQDHPEAVARALTAVPERSQVHDWRRYVSESYRFGNAIAVCERFAVHPPVVVETLWQLACGANAAKRRPAQIALGNVPGIRARIRAALADGAKDTRMNAAAWIATLRDREAIPALETAVRKEQQDQAKAAMMSALEILGVPIDRFLDRKALAGESAKALFKSGAKVLPDTLSWLDVDALPLPQWSDGSGALARDILAWWLVQAVKAKNPAPTPLLRRYAGLFVPAEAHALGQRILADWIAADTRLPNAQEAVELEKKLRHIPLEYIETVPAGSLIGAKGALAVAGAMGGPGLAPLVVQYLTTWYGTRAAHCRALLQMLAGVEHPSAIQILLATATRFRTASIRAEAETQVKAIADRHGWTVDELADRTIPLAGLNADGTRTLTYGPRSFTLRLLVTLVLRITDDAGTVIKELPAPRVSDDEALAATAKKQAAETRKQLKTIIKQQTQRLYEAMCTGRRWAAPAWREFLLAHPIAGPLCRQVVWSWGRDQAPGSAPAGSFRAMDDATLGDSADNLVKIDDAAWIAVAHPLSVGETSSAAWRQHLFDYDIIPLFRQFERTPYVLPAGLAHETRITDFKGHMVEAFHLRGIATKNGWTRGPAEDGGWFHVYRKSFTGIGVAAVLEFTGNALPEENRTVALIALYFQRQPAETDPMPGSGGNQEAKLGDISATLRSECWNDLHDIAAKGTGFDPAWESKTGP